MPTIIELDIPAIADESVARALLTAIEELPGFEPRRYDLNQRGNFRAWDLELAIVDLLTQRTQLFVVQGAGGEALIATGKHGEPPTLALSTLLDENTANELAERLGGRLILRG